MIETVDVKPTYRSSCVTYDQRITRDIQRDHDQELNAFDRHEEVTYSLFMDELPVKALDLHWKLTVIPIDVLFVQPN